MSLTIGFVYNLKDPSLRVQTGRDDEDAEFEDDETVESIAQALERLDGRVVRLPYRRELLDDLRSGTFDIVFNIAEGSGSRNRESFIPAILEMLGIPHTGSDPLTLGLTQDKALCKTIVQAAGVNTPRFQVASSPDGLDRFPLRFPLFVKPNHEGSSKGIRDLSKVHNTAELRDRVAWTLDRYRQPVLIEEFVDGTEFSVGLLGNHPVRALPVVEVVFGSEGGTDRFYSFEWKQIHQDDQEELRHPPRLPRALEDELSRMAIMAFDAVGCRDLGRVDFRVDRQGVPYFLELNALPGLSPTHSVYTFQATAAGLTHPDLIHRILAHAMERYGIKDRDSGLGVRSSGKEQ